MNPIYDRERKSGSRSVRFPAVLTTFNIFLAIFPCDILSIFQSSSDDIIVFNHSLSLIDSLTDIMSVIFICEVNPVNCLIGLGTCFFKCSTFCCYTEYSSAVCYDISFSIEL